mgnify:CR=1 FL=1
MARAAVKSTEIPEAKIRQAIWMIKSKKVGNRMPKPPKTSDGIQLLRPRPETRFK